MNRWAIPLCLAILLAYGYASAATRLGMVVTEEELAHWKTRWTNGPYRVAGDVSANSPGDQARINTNATEFRANPTSFRFPGNTSGACFSAATNCPLCGNEKQFDEIEAAAFRYLVVGNVADRDAVLTELLWHATAPGLDFDDGNLWCVPLTWGNERGHTIADFMIKLAFAYDFIQAGTTHWGHSAISAGNLTTLNNWFLDAGQFFEANIHQNNLDGICPDRKANNYATCNTALASQGLSMRWFEGAANTRTSTFNQFWTNQQAAGAGFVGIVGVLVNNATLTTEAKRYFKEQMQYGVYPDNTMDELRRAISGVPAHGWTYPQATLAQLVVIADVQARNGDTELYDFTTSVGVGNTAGGTKGLKEALKQHLRLMTHDLRRCGSSVAGNCPPNTDNFLIDSNDETLTNGRMVYDVFTAQANNYYKDTFIKAGYMRTAAGAPAYPVNPTSGGFEPWGGAWGTQPGILFQYGNMADDPAKNLNPYNLDTADTLAPKPPTGLTVTCATQQCSLSWTKPTQNTDNSSYTDPGGYRVRWCSGEDCTLANIVDLGDVASFNHTALQPETLHRYEVAAFDDDNNFSTFFTPVQEDTTDPAAPPELVAHYQFATDASDTTANNHDGVVTGGGTFSTVDGKAAAVFDGTTGHIRVTRTAALEPSALTLCAFVRRNGVQMPYADVINKTFDNDGSPTFESYALHADATPAGRMRFTHGKAGGSEQLNSSDTVLPDLTWVRVCARYNPSGPAPQKAIFINGNLDTSVTTTTALAYSTTDPNRDLYMGWGTFGTRRFKGALADVRLYNGPLSDAKIAALDVGDPGESGAFSQSDWRWRAIDSPETGAFQRPAQTTGQITAANQTRLRTVISRSTDNSPLTEFLLYCRVPAGSGATENWWALNDDCETHRFCYGLDKRLDHGLLTTPQVVSAGNFSSGGKFYKAFGNRLDQVSVPASKSIEREHAIRVRSDVAVGTTVGCCERLGTGTEIDDCESGDYDNEAIGVVVPPAAYGG